MPRPAVFPDVEPIIRQRMAQIRSSGTRPEIAVRQLLHRRGYRYRLYRKDLPGKPDIVFPSRHKVVFVHGCFWHRHSCPLARSIPSTRQEYWIPKFKRTIERDEANIRALARLGWETMVVWECETKHLAALQERLEEFLQ